MLRVIRGDTWNLSWEWLHENGDPVDLTDCTVRMQMRKQINGSVSFENSTDLDMVIIPLEGIIDLKVEPDDTKELVGQYLYDVEVTFPDGTVVTPIISKIDVIRDVTR